LALALDMGPSCPVRSSCAPPALLLRPYPAGPSAAPAVLCVGTREFSSDSLQRALPQTLQQGAHLNGCLTNRRTGMTLFGSSSRRRVPAGRRLGRELAHAEHAGWRKLVLVRHGQTDYNIKHLLPGELLGIPLNEEGRREARATAEALLDLPINTIVASPL